MAKAKTPVAVVEPKDTWPQWQRSPNTYAAGRAAIDTVDILALDAEKYWGCGKLRLLVAEDVRAKFDAQRLKLDHAIRHGDLEQLRTESARMANAWRYLDQAARDAGCPPLHPKVKEIAMPDGRVAAIVETMADARHVIAAGRHVLVFDDAEIGNLLQNFPALVKVKETFPGAEITVIRPIRDPLEDWEENGDEIPFSAGGAMSG
jgi:hypothetical protein